jgi:hypothetical protein
MLSSRSGVCSFHGKHMRGSAQNPCVAKFQTGFADWRALPTVLYRSRCREDRSIPEFLMAEKHDSWWAHGLLAVIIAGLFAAIPFWTHGLSIQVAAAIAAIIFLAVLLAYALVVRAK